MKTDPKQNNDITLKKLDIELNGFTDIKPEPFNIELEPFNIHLEPLNIHLEKLTIHKEAVNNE